jgi:hypothetical protein
MAGMSANAEKNISLMPKKTSDIVHPKGATQPLSVSDKGLKVSFDNTKSDKKYDFGRSPAPYWLYQSIGKSRSLDMENSRGIAVTVEGDGSNSVLHVWLGMKFARVYAIDIDFTGKRTIEIPNGEACQNRIEYNNMKTTTGFRYNMYVDRFGAYLTEVPAGKKAGVAILDIRTLHEDHEAGLTDPALILNGVKASVSGSIPYNHYIVYPGGPQAKVYNSTWNFVQDLPVNLEGEYRAVQGKNTFSIETASSANTWVSSRIKVQDLGGIMRIKKPAGSGSVNAVKRPE